ncbi:TetR family transcriptional regulator [Williamsia limnetica]|uniref:TetR family transcriptional regulator n=1 Tax=Williamsia limnetica TaxID=882452 RepID=A0A318RK70_WILLI|nr:TetR/AcrR family transcriptional regulator [Williamsia limnetica]PYE16251.1 TetR family transcriptional regulator [Williamsia limnetica]
MSIDRVGLSAKQRLVLTAERLYAVHGLDGVPLRQIVAEAGMGNKTAVQYHFGSKEGLIQAILVNRLDDLDRRRELLQARVPANNLRAVVEAHQLPLIELAEDDNCFYLPFLEQLVRKVDPMLALPASNLAAENAYYERVEELLTDVPIPLRPIRVRQASATALHTCADRQRSRLVGSPVPPYALHVSHLLDSLIAALTAKPSRETRSALEAWIATGQD